MHNDQADGQSIVQVRLANWDEAAAIAAVLYEAFVEYEAIYTPEAFAITTPTLEEIQKRWSEGLVWIALYDNRVVGTVAAVAKGEALYVRSLAILPEARGRGLGQLLLQQVENFAKRQALSRLCLSTAPFLHRAIRLYEQLEFTRTDEGAT